MLRIEGERIATSPSAPRNDTGGEIFTLKQAYNLKNVSLRTSPQTGQPPSTGAVEYRTGDYPRTFGCGLSVVLLRVQRG